MPLRNQGRLLICLAAALWACAAPSSPAPAADLAPGAAAADPEGFSGEGAWRHLEALAAIGPREMDGPGADAARAYVAGELRGLGIDVVELAVAAKRIDGGDVTLHNLLAEVPGESSDLFLVLAPYDTRGFDGFANLGVNDGGSGVAVALELARVVARDPLPYTTWFVFLEGEQEARGGIASAHIGARALAGMLQQRGALEQVRMALIINRVCDPDLRIARDLSSHRVYRDELFRAAGRLGFTKAFDPVAEFESPEEGQAALRNAGLGRVVVLADTSFGGQEPPGPYADSADDDLEHCAADSLDVVGRVAREGMQSIAARLRRIDRFASSPVAGTQALALGDLMQPEAAPEAAPEAETAAESAAESATEAPQAEPVPSLEAQPEPAPDAGAAAEAAQPPSEAPDRAAEAAAAP